jgi:hypothetical protein
MREIMQRKCRIYIVDDVALRQAFRGLIEKYEISKYLVRQDMARTL